MTTNPPPVDPAWQPYPGALDPSIRLLVRRRVLSPQLRNFRDIMIALPPSYDTTTHRYPVVYMQDGQNLFDPATAFAGHWQLTTVLADLAAQGTEAIVVGIANHGRNRLYEYSPFPDQFRGGGGGDRYLAFLAETLKPIVDRDFRTNPARSSTAIAGSSMGGLISLYGLYRFADVFGAAGVMSPSLWYAGRSILDYVEAWSALAVGRLYLDIGLQEPKGAVTDTRALRDLLAKPGPGAAPTVEYVEDHGGIHDEATWGRRFSRCLPFLTGRSGR